MLRQFSGMLLKAVPDAGNGFFCVRTAYARKGDRPEHIDVRARAHRTQVRKHGHDACMRDAQNAANISQNSAMQSHGR
jgi:hypothetical protein